MDSALRHRGAHAHWLRTDRACFGYRGPAIPSTSQAASDGTSLTLTTGTPQFQNGKSPDDLRVRTDNVIGGAFIWVHWNGRQLSLVRDPAGERTVYFGVHGRRFFFASEPKGVLAVPGFPRRLRSGALAQYLSFSFVPGQLTMLQDLSELPAGHVLRWSLDDSSPTVERYFHFEREARQHDGPPESSTDWPREFRAQLGAVIRQRLAARDDQSENTPVGIFLSGGLDSSVVTAELTRQTVRPVHSYSIHFGQQYPNELSFARAVASQVGTVHHEIELRPRDFLPRFAANDLASRRSHRRSDHHAQL